MSDKAFYSEHDLDAKGILSRATRWRMRQVGEFPEPVKISRGRVAYPAAVIQKWIDERSGVEAHAA